jgi:hypothetical protein
MTEPTNDTSLTPLAAIRCGNMECKNSDIMFFNGCGIHGSGVAACEGYRPANHIPDATKKVEGAKLIRCGNTQCELYDTASADCCAEHYTMDECGDHIPAEADADHIVDANKMVKCGNTECPKYTPDAKSMCAVGKSWAELCTDYRPADHIPAPAKPTPQPPDAAFILRTERDQARAALAIARDERDMEAAGRDRAHNALRIALGELGDLRRALELTGHVLPDIDDAVWEYSPVGEEKTGEWSEMWIAQRWEGNEKYEDYVSYLTRRRRRVRRAPTDADAIEQPRRPCWVRDYKHEEGKPMQLLAVIPSPHLSEEWRYLVITPDGFVDHFSYCEIEVEA